MSLSVRVGQTLPDTQNTEAPLGSVYIPELSVDKLTSGEISAATITMGDDGRILIGTDTKIELNQLGLFATKDGQPVFKLDKDGVEVTGKVNAIAGTFSGRLEGSDIVGGTIQSASIQGGTIAIGNGNSVFLASGLGISVGNGSFLGSPFRVSAAGEMVATNATIQGTVQGSVIKGSTITAGENNTFSVDALGQLSATGALITGTIRTAASGPRLVLMHNGLLDGGVGQLAFFTGVSGETAAGIYATNQSGVGYKKVFSFTTGRDGATGYVGPAMIMSVADAPAGGQWAQTNFQGDQFYFEGTVTVSGNVQQLVTFSNSANWEHWDSTGASATAYGRVKFYKDIHNNVHIRGLARSKVANAASDTAPLFVLPVGYRPNTRTLINVSINGTTYGRLDVMTNGNVVVSSPTVPSGAYVSFNDCNFSTDTY